MDIAYGILALALIVGFLAYRFMLPMVAVRLQLGALLAADSTTLAPSASANKIALITAAFSPVETLVIGDLTLASSGGLAPLAGVTGTQEVGVDPVNGDQVIQIKAPAGGYRWITSGATYPTTIYGYALTDNAGATLLAVAQLPVPIALQADGQFIEIDPVYMRLVLSPIS